jgi:hypothetical protein
MTQSPAAQLAAFTRASDLPYTNSLSPKRMAWSQ